MAEGQFRSHTQSLRRPAGGREALPWRIRYDVLDIAERAGPHQARPHQHGDYEIIVALIGGYRCFLNQVELNIAPGDLIAIKPGDWHQDHCLASVRFAALRFTALPRQDHDTSAMLLRHDLNPLAQVIAPAGERLLAILDDVRAAQEHPGPFAAGILDCLTLRFVWEMLRRFPVACIAEDLATEADIAGDGQAITKLIDERLDDPPTPAELAAALGISPRTLTARCRAAFAESPARFILRRRLERAREDIIQTGMPVVDAAKSWGFHDPFHFSRAYKRCFGVPPTRHRIGGQGP
ncbi:hypothetical protein LBMAG53_20510 [Planctomycetota bacterium]|nr:hypothetical protein LBMAG53_20510 [Planctomycetota bacterium]